MRALSIRLILTLVLLMALALFFAVSMAAAAETTAPATTHVGAADGTQASDDPPLRKASGRSRSRSSEARSASTRPAAVVKPVVEAAPVKEALPQPASAGTPPPPVAVRPAPQPASESLLGAGSKLLVASLILAGLLYGGMRLMRRLPIARFLPTAEGPIRVTARTHLGAKESLCLVEVGATSVLLGITPQGVQTLHVWPEGPASHGRDGGPPARSGMEMSVPGQLRALEARVPGSRR